MRCTLPRLSALALLTSLTACGPSKDQPVTTFAGQWEHTTLPAAAGDGSAPILRRRNLATGQTLLYFDTNHNGQIDQVHDDRPGGSIIWRDTDHDGHFDSEYFAHPTSPTPRFLRGIHEPVPTIQSK